MLALELAALEIEDIALQLRSLGIDDVADRLDCMREIVLNQCEAAVKVRSE